MGRTMAAFITMDSITELVANIQSHKFGDEGLSCFVEANFQLLMYNFVVGSIDGVGKCGGRVTGAPGEGGFHRRGERWQLKTRSNRTWQSLGYISN